MKIVVHVQTNRVGSKVEREVDIPDDELIGMDEQERDEYVSDWAHDEVFENNMFEWGWEEVPE